MSALALAGLFLAAATLYTTVGHGGASGYLAAMALVGVEPQAMRPTALTLNILASAIALARFARAGRFDWRVFYPFALASVPFAFLGGLLVLPPQLYKPAVGGLLLVAAVEIARTARRGDALDARVRPAPRPLALAAGAGIGLVSGLTGVGGGIFLSPLLLLARWAPTRTVSGVAAAFILVNSVAGLAGTTLGAGSFPPALALWIGAAATGALAGSHLGVSGLATAGIRYVLTAVLVVAGLKMILT